MAFETPNPQGSAKEKLEVPRKAWAGQHASSWDRLLRAEGIDPDLAQQLARAFQKHSEQSLLDVEANYRTLEHWGNVHTHGPSTALGQLESPIGDDLWTLVADDAPLSMHECLAVIRGDRYLHVLRDRSAIHVMLDLATLTWSTLANYPGDSGNAALGSHFNLLTSGGYLYAFGGLRSDGLKTNQSWRYNPADDTWTSVAPTVNAPSRAGCAEVDGVLYYSSPHTDPDKQYHWTDEPDVDWVQIAEWPWGGSHRLATGELVAYNGSLYAREASTSFYTGSHDLFVLSGGSWASAAKMEDGGGNHHFLIQEYLYVLTPTGSVQRTPLDATTFQGWEAMTPPPAGKQQTGGLANRPARGLVYRAGGDEGDAQAFEVWVYDP